MDAQSPTAFDMISASMSESGEFNELYRNLCTEANMDSSTLERALQTYRTMNEAVHPPGEKTELEKVTKLEETAEPEEATEPGETSEPEETAELEKTTILTLRALDDCAAMADVDALEEAWFAFMDADTMEEGSAGLR